MRMVEQLVFVENGRPVTDSLTVAREFRKSHDHVIRDIRQQLVKLNDAEESEWGVTNFGETQYQNQQNGQWYTKFDLTEEAFAIIAMSYTTPEAMKMKVKFIEEFKRMRLELTKPRMLTRLELIEMARESELARIEAEAKLLESERKNAEYQMTIQEQAPMVLFAEAVTTSHDSVLVRELAVILKQNNIDIGEKRLFSELRERGFLIKRKGSDWNMPTQKSMELKLFQVKETPILHSSGDITVSKTPKVTGKGQQYFVNLFRRELVAQEN